MLLQVIADNPQPKPTSWVETELPAARGRQRIPCASHGFIQILRVRNVNTTLK